VAFNYTIKGSGGSAWLDNQLRIYVYPDNHNDKDMCENQIIPALINAAKQAYNESQKINYWQVAYAPEVIPHVWDTDDDAEEALNEWRSFLKGEYGLSTGSHLLIETDGSNGYAGGGDISCNDDRGDKRSAWKDWAPAVMGTDGYGGDYGQNIAIMEAFHNFIDHCKIEHLIRDNEHDLGKVYSNYWGDKASPMVTTYTSGHQEHGNCSDGAWTVDGYSHDLTSCTITACDESI
jgi:hypothetical protein